MNAKVLQSLATSPALDTPAGPEGTLPMGVLLAEGPEAVTFLQGQLTQDLRPLQPGQWCRAALCTAQGRVLALPKVVAIPGGLWLVMPRERVAPVLAHLQRFVLRAKLKLRDVSGEWTCRGEVAPADPADGPLHPVVADGASRRLVLSATRTLVIAPTGTATGGGTGATFAEWLQASVQDGEPEVFDVSAEAWTPHMLAQERWGAISLTKGCYTGQEIVARTHYLGKNKRSLVGVSLAPPAAGTPLPAPGDAVMLPDGRRAEWVMGVQGPIAVDSLLVAAEAAPSSTPTP
jgi:tRNA-modifying protein YgfZ